MFSLQVEFVCFSLNEGRHWNIQGILTVALFRFKSIEVFAVVRTLVKSPRDQAIQTSRGPLFSGAFAVSFREDRNCEVTGPGERFHDCDLIVICGNH